MHFTSDWNRRAFPNKADIIEIIGLHLVSIKIKDSSGPGKKALTLGHRELCQQDLSRDKKDLEDNMKIRTQGSELLTHRYHGKGENPEKLKKQMACFYLSNNT